MFELDRAEEQIDAHKMYMQRMDHVVRDERESGWYQDDKGNLYHFNGSAWDMVPEYITRRLEYLG